VEAKRFEAIPDLTDAAPPLLLGTAALAHRAYAGAGLADLLGAIRRPTPTEDTAAALTLDAATAHRLHFRAEAADALQAQALASGPLYRVADSGRSARPLRVLALMAPGDLMANTPLDFITAELDVRLDLLFVLPGRPLPASLPDHDVAFFAAGDADSRLLVRLAALRAAWPRPSLNDPACVPRLSREALAAALRHRPELLCPAIQRLPRQNATLPAGWAFPVLVRPVGSHAGQDLTRADDADALAAALARIDSDEVFLSHFIDYRGRDGLFRKYRVAFIAGAPFLCHMAVSEHWMVHYLNAGMAESRAKRDAEAAAMASFDADFARRHADAFAVLTEWARLDYFQIDCAEAPDARLLLFEADVAGIVHTMDPPDLFPYKPPQMRRVMAAFGAMLARHAPARATAPAPAMAG
jgi:hypothetical protein